MPFLLLLLLSVALLGDSWPEPLWWAGISSHYSFFLVLTGAAILLVGATAFSMAQWTCRALRRFPDRHDRILQRYGSWRSYHSLGIVVVYGMALYGLGWGWAVQTLCSTAGPEETGGISQMVPGAELLILAPYFIALVLSWACFYSVEQAVHQSCRGLNEHFWTRREYLSFHCRQNLALIIAPLGLMIATKGLQRSVPDDSWAAGLIGVGLLVAVFISLPWILRLVLKLQSLPPGPLRDRLELTAKRLNFRYSNILLWNTHGGVANAMVAGLLPFPRYILLTDRLVSELTPDEVEAVFGHEVGHVKHAHMLYYAGFLVLSILSVAFIIELLTWIYPELQSLSAGSNDSAKISFVGIAGAYILVVFGFLSRRCERQADVYGCRAISCGRSDCLWHGQGTSLTPGANSLCPTGIRTFISALEKVAHTNGISRSKPGWLQSWQHSTIARRVGFLQQILVDPVAEPRFQRNVRRVKWALLGSVAGICVLILGILKYVGAW
jgi:Zn-dependent protease with chaperone function